MKRILIYSHDTFGLGNIRRMLEVARHLVQASPAVSVLVVTGSPMLHAFRLPPRIDYLKLPCLSRNVDGHYGARSLNLSLGATVKMRANLLKSAIEDFEPDLIVVDKKPFGVEDELCGAFEALSSHTRRPKLALLLRDILDSPEATTRVWRKNGCFEAIEAYYDQVLVVGDPAVFDLRHEYDFPPFCAAKVAFCGYIGREPGREARADVRRRLEVQGAEPLLLVTTGGGEDGYGLVDTCLRGLEAMPHAERPRTHIVCGPEMGASQRQDVMARATALPQLSVQEFSDDMMSLIAASDVVVAMGGYNTVCELLTSRRRAIIVPRVKPGLEQCIRAERMAALGLLRMLHPQGLGASTLMGAVLAELHAVRSGTPLRAWDALDGLAGTTRELLGLLDLEPAPAPADDTAADALPAHARRAATAEPRWHA
ncbi:MAG: glycosyltransferase [Rubrivivax sp.]|nr:glycosyltransferase [Rubrivivax sp.]